MLIGVLGDTHDHLQYIRAAVDFFNREGCARVIHAGDFVSPIALPPFRKLACRMVAVFGDNDGNRAGLAAGFGVLGSLSDAPAEWVSDDGRRVLVTHRRDDLANVDTTSADLVVFSHTHRTHLEQRKRTLWLNPGEACGWVFGEPTVALYDTVTAAARIVPLVSGDGCSK